MPSCALLLLPGGPARATPGTAGQVNAIDAHVVLLARKRGWPVLTSDPDDLLGIDPGLGVERI